MVRLQAQVFCQTQSESDYSEYVHDPHQPKSSIKRSQNQTKASLVIGSNLPKSSVKHSQNQTHIDHRSYAERPKPSVKYSQNQTLICQ